MWEHINVFMALADNLGLEQGMITNGILLKKKISPKNLKRLKWLRISMNSLDYVESVSVPNIPGTLGFSYVMNKRSTFSMSSLQDHVLKYKLERGNSIQQN